MRRARVGLLSILVVLLAVALAACSSAPTVGSLKVSVSGLPSDTHAAVKVAMGSFSKTVTATTTLSGLAPGTYTLASQSVTLRRNVFVSTVSKASVTVSAGATASDSVSYAAQRGDLWTPDAQNSTVSMYAAGTLESSPTPAATITNDIHEPTDLAFDAGGNLWVANFGSGANSVVEYAAGTLTSNPGPAATVTTGLSFPTGVAFDGAGNLWVASEGSGTVQEYAAASLTSSPSPVATITTSAHKPVGVALDVFGNLWVAHQATTQGIEEYAAADIGAGGSLTPTATIGGLTNVQQTAFDPPPYDLPLSH